MLTGSQRRQDRVLTTVGAIVLALLLAAATLAAADPFGGRPANRFALTINTPYVGQGVEAGTGVVLHGVKVGVVTAVNNLPGGGVRLATELERQPLRGLTDAMAIDYRPVNYFGVPGINLIPNAGGQPIRDGGSVKVVPKGNFTLSQLLSELGGVSQASLTPQLINVIDRVTRYTDGLNPFFETAVTVTRTVAAVQTVPTELLLANTASAVAALPTFADAVVTAGTRYIDYTYYPGEGDTTAAAASGGPQLTYPYMKYVKQPQPWEETEEFFQNSYITLFRIASGGLFASVGKLLSSHVDDLFGLISGVKAITDTVPPLLRPQDLAEKLAELRSRFERLYAGDGQQRAVSVRIVLDRLPGVAAPIGIQTGGPQ